MPSTKSKKPAEKVHASAATVQTIRAAIEPMTSTIEKEYLEYLEAAIVNLTNDIAAAEAEMMTAIKSTPADARKFTLPKWMSTSHHVWTTVGVYKGDTRTERPKTHAEAMEEIKSWCSDGYSLASRKADPNSRIHGYIRERIADAKRYTEVKKKGGLKKLAREMAESEVESTIYKLARKLEGWGVRKSAVTGRTTSFFSLDLILNNGKKLVMNTNRILNRSVYGTPFNQWPTRLKLDGKAISEAAMRRLAKV